MRILNLKMFHVERTLPKLMNKGKRLIFLILFVASSCGIAKQKYTIADYVIVPNAKEILGNKGLNAFVFENNKKIIPFQQFITTKFKSNSYQEKEFWVTIDGDKFKIILYDNDELEKYINVSDFIVSDQNPDIVEIGSQADFIAISMINESNEDCLAQNSLYENIATNYLKKLKEEYFKHDR